MKKLYTFLALYVLTSLAYLSAQTVTTTPAIITDDYTGTITLTYDPAGGAMATAANCYAHIGVGIGALEWQCAPAWRSALAKHKMVKSGSNWVLTIDNIYTYFSACTGPFNKISMVFNDGATGIKEGKTASGGDFSIAISPAGQLNVSFTNASSSGAINAGSSVSFTANSTSAANLEIKKNGQSVKTATNATNITHTETLSNVGDYTFTVTATSGVKTATDTRTVSILSPAESQARPSGLKEGTTYNATDNTKLHLCLYAKDRSNVLPDNIFVIGDFNNWSMSNAYQMKKDGTSGYWWTELTGLEPGKEYAFQYAVKIGTKIVKISDPYSEKVLHPDDQWEPSQQYPNLKPYPSQGEGYVSIIQTNKTAFSWSAATLNFAKPNRNNLVIYELWVYDFSPIRNIRAVTARLDYLENLGVNAIQLMPMTEFEGNMSWGYNPTHYFAMDKAYGTSDDLKRFIDECHKRGIAVILDMVFNHVTGAAPQAKLYWGSTSIATNNPWFNQIAPHGASVNQDYDHNFGPTRDMFKRVLKYWIDEYKVDGYRMDISHGFCGSDCSNRTDIMFDYYNNGVKAGNEQAYFILEHWEHAAGERENYNNWGMNCHLNNTESYQQTAMGWLKDGDGLDNSNQDGFITYCESHDEERNMFKARSYGNGATIRSTAGFCQRVPLNTAFNVLLNGSHMMYMFQELGYDYSILSNQEGDAGDRVSPKPVPESLGWYTNANRMSAYQKLGQIIQLRTRLMPSVFDGNPTNSDLGSEKAARSVIWGSGNDRIFLVGNFNAPSDGATYTGSVNISLPSGNSWYDYLSNGTTAMNAGASVTLQPGEVKLYTATRKVLPTVPSSYANFSTGGIDNVVIESDIECTVYPTIASDFLYVETQEEVNNISIVSIKGYTYPRTMQGNSIAVSDLEKGQYLLILTFNNEQQAYRFVKE